MADSGERWPMVDGKSPGTWAQMLKNKNAPSRVEAAFALGVGAHPGSEGSEHRCPPVRP
jgi:hypothetical protein